MRTRQRVGPRYATTSRFGADKSPLSRARARGVAIEEMNEEDEEGGGRRSARGKKPRE